MRTGGKNPRVMKSAIEISVLLHSHREREHAVILFIPILTRSPPLQMMRLLLLALCALSIFGQASAFICACSCCLGLFCEPQSAGNITVNRCSQCGKALCQSTYSSWCSATNGYTGAFCKESTTSAGSALFEQSHVVFACTILILLFSIHSTDLTRCLNRERNMSKRIRRVR